jgi:hypothetical protein
VAQRFTAAIIDIFSVPALQGAEKFDFEPGWGRARVPLVPQVAQNQQRLPAAEGLPARETNFSAASLAAEMRLTTGEKLFP